MLFSEMLTPTESRDQVKTERKREREVESSENFRSYLMKIMTPPLVCGPLRKTCIVWNDEKQKPDFVFCLMIDKTVFLRFPHS